MVTLARIVLIPIFLVALLVDWPSWLAVPRLMAALQPWIAAVIFTLIAATDGIDGYLARTRNEITTFGKFLDPLADKLLVTAALLALVSLGILPAWVALLIISREFIVSGLRMVASAEGIVIAASWYGKVKTVLQVIAIILFIVKDSRLFSDANGMGLHLFAQAVAWSVMGAACIMTMVSMADYFRHAADVLVGPWADEADNAETDANDPAADGADGSNGDVSGSEDDTGGLAGVRETPHG